jgi:hypothetical protein
MQISSISGQQPKALPGSVEKDERPGEPLPQSSRTPAVRGGQMFPIDCRSSNVAQRGIILRKSLLQNFLLVSGHDLSRAANAPIWISALAAAELQLAENKNLRG